jgi:uncharacterized repeat protein (TIGR01451 family)
MVFVRALVYFFIAATGLAWAGRAEASTCAPATRGGSAPTDWPSFCWLDFSGYNDALARSPTGQNFTFTLNDGSTLSFVAKVTSSAATALKAVTAPAWTGAAVGNTAFLGIPGNPILYTATDGSTVTVTFSGITLAPPAGISGGSTYSFVAADGESTNGGESLAFTTDKANWTVLDQVPPISGSIYPTTSNTGTTFTETGVGGTVGGYIVGSTNATQVTTTLVASGLQGAMFALRYSSISLNNTLVGARVNAADQFTYKISATSSGATLGSATSSGAGNGPFGQTSSFITTPQSLTLSESMAPGSVDTLASSYSLSLTCTNATAGSTTPMPTNLASSSYVFSTIAFGDVISCNFVNTARPPLLTLTKSAPTPNLQVGVNSVYTLTVSNAGQGAVNSAQVKDQLPANLTFVSASGTNWSCGNVASLVTCNFAGGTLAPGSTSTIAVTVTAPAAAAGASDTNYASIDPTGGTAAPAPGATCSPAASCASSGPNTIIYINAVADAGSAVAGTASTPIANVAANDFVNGVAATLGPAGNGSVTPSGALPTGISLSAAGAVTTAATVAPGVYVLQYQLCDKRTPADCAVTTATVTVTASIVALAASGSAVAGTASTPILNVAANDSVNGVAATLGAAGNAVVTQSGGAWPAGIALTSAGAVTVSATVAPGSYSVQYQLCDKNTPPNCATATDTITVTASIVPVADSGNAIAGTASTPIASVVMNDTVNGVAATLGASGNATVAQAGAWPPGIALNAASGAVTTTAAVAPGTYGVQYRLCDKNTPPDCATTTDTVTVAASIVAKPASGNATAGSAATPIVNVAANDSVNGVAASLGAAGNATVAQSGTWPAGVALNAVSGALSTTAAVPPGTYSVQYQLCDKNTPANCATAVDTVTVSASIVPMTDSGSAVAGTPSTPITNVAANDSVNGVPATLGAAGNATVSQSGTWPAGIALNTASGAVTTTAGVAPGSYSVMYQLCDKSAPPNCATTSDIVTVTASIVPQPDSGSVTAGGTTAGGATPGNTSPVGTATAISNVAANDSVNGVAATLGATGNATVAQSGTAWPVGITLSSAGAVNVSATVAPGSYGLQYQLCDRSAPPDCAVTTVSISVVASIVATAAAGSTSAGSAGTAIANIATNDTVNGAHAVLSGSRNAVVAQTGTWPAGLSLNPSSGAISTTAAVPPGVYRLAYQLCDLNTPANCATATDTVTVTAAIKANLDPGSAVAGTPSTPIANIAAMSTVNGQPATLGPAGNATVAQNGTWPTGFSLSATGAVTTTALVPPGSYSLPYQLCDKNTPPDCVVASDTVNVTANIVPVTESGTAVAGTASTPVANVTANDSVNGVAAKLGTAGNATVSQVGTWPAGLALNATSGAITTSAALRPGTYVLTYQLCDKNTPPDCANVNDTIKVSASVVPTAISGTAVTGTAATPIANIVASDTVDGQAATLGIGGNATVAQSGVWPSGITLNAATGAVTTTAAVLPGTYSLTYVLCDTSTPPLCASAPATVTVKNTTGGALLIDKSASTHQAEIGDSVQYRIQVRNPGTGVVVSVVLNDSLPLGFNLLAGTTLIGRDGATPTKAADPKGAPGPALTWSLGNIGPGEIVEIDYRLRVTAGAQRGNGTNLAQAVGLGISSAVASARVQISGGAFDTSACVVGKIYVDCNGNRVQDAGEPGIPGVRLYFEDGTNLTSDENGNYSICGQRPITHVLKVDPTTLPAGSRLVTVSSRNAGDGDSLFVDLRDGELHRADFAEGSCTNKVMDDVHQRAHHGAILAPLPPMGREHVGVDFESPSSSP